MKVQLPGNKVANYSREFAWFVAGKDTPAVYYFDTDEIEIEGVEDEEKILKAYEKFEHDEMFGRPQHHKRAVELLDKDELTDEEEHELRKLERKVLRELLRGRQ
jgi:hypothetical protein